MDFGCVLLSVRFPLWAVLSYFPSQIRTNSLRVDLTKVSPSLSQKEGSGISGWEVNTYEYRKFCLDCSQVSALVHHIQNKIVLFIISDAQELFWFPFRVNGSSVNLIYANYYVLLHLCGTMMIVCAGGKSFWIGSIQHPLKNAHWSYSAMLTSPRIFYGWYDISELSKAAKAQWQVAFL